MLTFEYSNSDEKLEIHLDETGIKDLIKVLNDLLIQEKSDHTHLNTAEWGGSELTSDKMNSDKSYNLINHVKVLNWK